MEARLRAAGFVATSWSNQAGDTYGAHSHGYDKVLVAVRGSITFHLVDMELDVLLNAGERLDLAAATAHAATVGAAGVTFPEAHLAQGSLIGPPLHRAARDW